jgi:alcohol dehydrogenase class IV
LAAFEYQSYGQRVVFGAGNARAALAAEVERLSGARILLIVADAEHDVARALTEGLPVAATFTGVRPHVPAAVAAAVRAVAADSGADVVVSVGGGSTTGTAKAVAMTTGLPIVAVPTTYAGSEATAVWGVTDAGRKTTGTHPAVLPRAVVYDPDLTMSLPVDLTVASGLNALAHCVDSLWAPNANPVSSALAVAGVRALRDGLPAVRRDAADRAARESLLYGAYLAALSFAGAGSGLHHKICHVLGGAYDLPHAPLHAVMLPHVLAFNAPAAPEAAGLLAGALGGTGAVTALGELYEALDAPRALRDLGLKQSHLDEAAGLVTGAAPPSNPRPVTRADAARLLHDAWAGDPPHQPEEDR